MANPENTITKIPAPDASMAVRVNNVSKVYGLWSSPKARLAHPVLNLMAHVMPFSRLSKSVEHRTRHMYREFHALQDISLEIKKGESWGFIGVNGSGKSTLLKIISGNLRPSSGSVEVDGKVAILDYGAGFNGEFTGRENVYLKASILGLTRKQIDARFASIEAFADIGDFIDQPVKTYSSGMSARLGFAIMSHVDADIMITDEALAVGDAFFVQKCMRHIHAFLKRGTFLFVSHSANDVMSLCDKAVWLEHGRIVQIGKASEVCRAYSSSMERKTSAAFLEEEAEATVESSESTLTESESVPIGGPRTNKQIRLTAGRLAELQNYFAPPEKPVDSAVSRHASFIVVAGQTKADDILNNDIGVGGARIFMTALIDDKDNRLTSVLGGEEVRLRVCVAAEEFVEKPIVGFQIKNDRGLTLIADNSYVATKNSDMSLEAGDVITVDFCFRMPLVSKGDYVVRVGFANGAENNNALLDVQHEALLLTCVSSGMRHGLVGIPMLGIEVNRKLASSFDETKKT